MQTSVEQLIADNKVMVFSKGYCPFCTKTKDLLKNKGVAFHAVEMDEIAGGDAMHASLKTYSGQNTVPNVYVNGKHIGGNDDTQAAAKNGKLKSALDAAGVANNF